MRLSVVLITLNEEENIEGCLAPWRWADEIVIVDSGSTDRTLQRARQFTDNIFEVPFHDYGSQKNIAISKAKGDWIFVLDADERLTPGLAQEIREVLRAGQADAVYAVRRKTHFFGKRLHHSGTEEDRPVRFFPRGQGRYVQPIHEVLESDLPVRCFENPLIHLSTRNLSQYRKKLKQYLDLEIKFMRASARRVTLLDLLIRPPAKFCYLYFAKMGLWDGWAGFRYAVLAGYYDFRKYLGALSART